MFFCCFWWLCHIIVKLYIHFCIYHVKHRLCLVSTFTLSSLITSTSCRPNLLWMHLDRVSSAIAFRIVVVVSTFIILVSFFIVDVILISDVSRNVAVASAAWRLQYKHFVQLTIAIQMTLKAPVTTLPSCCCWRLSCDEKPWKWLSLDFAKNTRIFEASGFRTHEQRRVDVILQAVQLS